MDAKLINLFIDSALHVLETVASITDQGKRDLVKDYFFTLMDSNGGHL